jgi:RimJ/RimL family protein N-acetyltransferase
MTFLGPKTFISASPEDTVTNWHTLGYRSYAPWRGTGIMKTFVGFAIGFYLEHYPTAQLWTGIHADNAASQGLATALGFTINEAASDREHDFLVMVRR